MPAVLLATPVHGAGKNPWEEQVCSWGSCPHFFEGTHFHLEIPPLHPVLFAKEGFAGSGAGSVYTGRAAMTPDLNFTDFLQESLISDDLSFVHLNRLPTIFAVTGVQ